MKAYILSKTRMGGDRFCTCVAIRDSTGAFVQKRLVDANGYAIKESSLPYSSEYLNQTWIRGRVIEIASVLPGAARQTHPEDMRVDPSGITIVGRRVSDEFWPKLLDAFTFDTIHDLYPGILKTGDKYLLDEPHLRSVGYVANARVQLFMSDGFNPGDPEKAQATITDSILRRIRYVPVVGTHLIEETRERRRFEFQGRIRLSIANPWARNDQRLCYIQLSDLDR